MLSNKSQATIKLCVIAALADGSASPKELDTISVLISESYGHDSTEISQYANQAVGLYTSEKLNEESYLAAAVAALKELCTDGENANDALGAYQIAFEVMYADDKVGSQERKFLQNVYDELEKSVDLSY
jgi:uncharacterized tellurite resistance protein B-like protein